MRIVCLIALLFTTSVAYSQSREWYGHVVDAQTGSPIGGANLSVAQKGIYFPTDKEGGFLMIDKALSKSDSVSFSCIGYQAKTVKGGDIVPDAVIKLTPLVKVLREVKVDLVQFGSKAKREEMWTAYNPFHEEALYMANPKHLKGTIQSVGFFLSNAVDGDVTAPFRISIYEASADTIPSRDLTRDVIIATAHQSNAWFDVDISTYEIPVPENGFFVSFCLIDGQHYRTSTRPDIGTNVVTPRLGMTQFEFNKHLSYHWQNRRDEWYWEREPHTNNYMIRAAVVPE